MTISFAMETSASTDYNSDDYIDCTAQDKKSVYEISDLGSITIDENGNIVEDEISLFVWTISGSHIEPGHTKFYFPSNNPDGFPITAYRGIEVNLSWGLNTSVEIGLEGGISTVKRGTEARVFLYPYTTGSHRLYIKNLGEVAIDVNGTIEL